MQRRSPVFTAEDLRPLADYLAQQPTAAVTLTFADIEVLLGKPLPRSAATWNWWRLRGRRIGLFQLVTARGWQVGTTHLYRIPPSITFVKADARGEATL